MTRDQIVNLHKGQRVRLPRYGIVGTIKDVVLTLSGRSFGIGEIEDSDGKTATMIGGGLIYVPASEVELLKVVQAA